MQLLPTQWDRSIPCGAVVTVLLMVWAAASGADDLRVVTPHIDASQCLVIAKADLDQHTLRPRPDLPPHVQKRVDAFRKDKPKLLKPITRPEVEAVIRAHQLRAIEPNEQASSAKQETPAAMEPPAWSERRVLTEKTGMSAERFGVVLGDIRSLLIVLHARDAAKTFGSLKDLPPEARKYYDQAFARIEGCGPPLYEYRGGMQAFQEALALVERLRPQLDPLILESMGGLNKVSGVPARPGADR